MMNPKSSGTSDEQAAVFAFLGDPETHGGAEVRRHDTHAAAVFLAGARALKVKRAVRFPFLDYSTLEKRKTACAAEIDVNRPFAPQIYRGIVPITREADGRLAIGGAGRAVEWAVEMVRFDENQTLDRIADRGGLDDALSVKLAVAVAAMHARSPRVQTEPWLAALEDYVGQNTAAFRERESLFPADQAAALDRSSRAALARLLPLLRTRGQAGFVRRGHGDLHLGNIAVLEGEPVTFDAIEFDPVVASGDVLYDLAFLLMDLVERDLHRAANIVLNGYFATTRSDADYDGLAALPLFMSLRAAIRAKVTAARLDQAPERGQDGLMRSAVRYFALAQSLLAPKQPTIACTGGLSGTGKSVLARSLASELLPSPGAIILRSDVERKATYGVAETSRLPPDAYREDVSARLYAALVGKARRIAQAGFSVIVDAVFAKSTEREAIESAARTAGARFCGLFLTADLATRLSRVGRRGPDASDADAAVARMQEQFAIGHVAWPHVDASGSPAETLSRARMLLPEAALKIS